MFHLVSLSLRISLAELLCLVPWLVCGYCLFVFCLCSLLVSCFQGNLISIVLKIPVVDRPCLALARQCRKKKIPNGEEVLCVKEQHQVRGREGALKSRATKTGKVEGHLPRESHVPFSNLDKAGHFGPFHGSNRRRRSRRRKHEKCNRKSGEMIRLGRTTTCLLVAERKQLDWRRKDDTHNREVLNLPCARSS